jgi:PAS domain S-box-containing protein
MQKDETSPEFKKIRVLIVEDDFQHVELLIECLKIYETFGIEWVSTLHDLWQHIEANHVDILILDNCLPDGTGIDAMKLLSEQKFDFPILMITGMGDENLAVKAMQSGASDYLVKGTNYISTLPNLILKAVKEHHNQVSYKQFLDQVHYQALLLNNVREAVVVWNTEGTITYWNHAAERMFGINSQSSIGRNVADIYFNQFTPQPILPTPESTCGQEVERRFISEFAPHLWISSRISVLRDFNANGKLIGFIDVSRDITSRKIAEKASRENETRYKMVSELVSDFAFAVLYEADHKITIEWITDAFKVVTGYSPDEINLAEQWTELVYPEDHENFLKTIQSLADSKGQITELRILTRKNEIRWLRIYTHPVIVLENLGGMRIYGAAKDITERKHLEEHIRSTQLQLAEGSRQAAIGDLASGVAHHINNPLSTIIAETQLLLNEIPPENSMYDSIRAIEKAGWRVQKAVQQLLDFSKSPVNSFNQLSLNQTIESALELVDEQIKSNDVDLKVVLSEEIPIIIGCTTKLAVLWTNLLILTRDGINNGQAHTVQITSKLDGNRVIVEFQDDGKLIPADEIGTIQEPDFFKTLGGRGCGIEMNICKEIVRQHNGEITVISSPEQGTIFRVSIPTEVA